MEVSWSHYSHYSPFAPIFHSKPVAKICNSVFTTASSTTIHTVELLYFSCPEVAFQVCALQILKCLTHSLRNSKKSLSKKSLSHRIRDSVCFVASDFVHRLPFGLDCNLTLRWVCFFKQSNEVF